MRYLPEGNHPWLAWLAHQAKGPFMTLVEAAALLGVTAATLRQQIANGKLRAVKRGRDWWVTRREVDRYQRDNRRTL
jgi:excisionase family DNA binding protein